MKKIHVLLLALAACLALTGCCLRHKWVEPDCESPKTCSECGKTEGEALGHSWQDATCTAPKTCSECGKTEGEALGHSWQDATCAAPKTCSACGETEGEALEHTWSEATCSAPKTCNLCGETEGDPVLHRIVDGSTETRDGHIFLTGTCSVCGEDTSAEYPDWESYFRHNIIGTWDCFVGVNDETMEPLTLNGSIRFVINEDGTWECIMHYSQSGTDGHESGTWEYSQQEVGYFFELLFEGDLYYVFCFDEESPDRANVLIGYDTILLCKKAV